MFMLKKTHQVDIEVYKSLFDGQDRHIASLGGMLKLREKMLGVLRHELDASNARNRIVRAQRDEALEKIKHLEEQVAWGAAALVVLPPVGKEKAHG